MTSRTGREPSLPPKHPAHDRVGGRLTPEQRQTLLAQDLGQGFLVYKSGPDTITEIPFYINRSGNLRRMDNRHRIESLPVERPIRPQDLSDPEYADHLDDYYSSAYDEEDWDEDPRFARQGAIRWAQKLVGGLYRHYVFLSVRTIGPRKNREVVGIGIMDPAGQMRVDSFIRPDRKLTPSVLAAAGVDKHTLDQAPRLCDIWESIHEALHGAVWVMYDREGYWSFLSAYHQCERHRTTHDRGSYEVKHEYARFCGKIDFSKRNLFFKEFTLAEVCQVRGIAEDLSSCASECRATHALVAKMAAAGVGMRWLHPWTVVPELDGPE